MGSLLFPGVWQAYPATLKEQVSANCYVTMVIYQKLLPRTKKRGVFYLSLKISSLNCLASYDEYPPGVCVNIATTMSVGKHPNNHECV